MLWRGDLNLYHFTHRKISAAIYSVNGVTAHMSPAFVERGGPLGGVVSKENTLSSPWVRLNTFQTFSLNEQVKSIYSSNYDQLHPTLCSAILKLTDQRFDGDDWLHIIKMINVCGSGQSWHRCSRPFDGGRLGQRQPVHPRKYALVGGTNDRKENLSLQLMEARAISRTPSSWLSVSWSKTLITSLDPFLSMSQTRMTVCKGYHRVD